ncbi:MAG: hypothetical protein KJO56_07110 [Gammaproteobacteria bacterium]|nr:hypothetical protein [Gammaproteobacteria bacterium]MBT8105826.1 hypothetical protein [Gammaproteobacteria bacterium]NNF49836.1 hypothetical protein [Woeseiaceae bacterium]NNK25840.1 hypothetical protein [Woeseiaceae bacterium]NNL64163.1 hypothetical protein [Woeseiaceae bacterium]
MLRVGLLITALCLAGAGCAVNEVIVAEETTLVVSDTPVEESRLLDVGIIEFAPGLDEDNDPRKTGVWEEIRLAETKYLAYHLKNTLQGTGHWGAVRVIPTREAFTDVVVSGGIRQSDGEYVTLDITVEDAAGRHWYDRVYKTQTGVTSFSDRRDRRLDPYQKVFNDIANDLHAFTAALPPKQLEQTRHVSELRFFADMSPLAYGQHLATGDDGIATILRLPAENDPTVARLRQIRERDRLVIDTLNEHYANFYYGIAIPYRNWRKVSRQEAVAFREVKRSARLQTLVGVVVLAGALAAETDNTSSRRQYNTNRALQNLAINEGLNRIIGGIQRGNDAESHVAAIAELSESFGAQAAPMVVSVEGQERRLTGTAHAQYDSWRRLLRDIYQAETGFTQNVDVGVPARTNAGPQ